MIETGSAMIACWPTQPESRLVDQRHAQQPVVMHWPLQDQAVIAQPFAVVG